MTAIAALGVFAALCSLAVTAPSSASVAWQDEAVIRAESAIEVLAVELRVAQAPLTIVGAGDEAALEGNRVEFSRFGETAVRSVSLVSIDDDITTAYDNTLVYDPNVSVDGDESVIARSVAPADERGAFYLSSPISRDQTRNLKVNLTVVPRN